MPPSFQTDDKSPYKADDNKCCTGCPGHNASKTVIGDGNNEYDTQNNDDPGINALGIYKGFFGSDRLYTAL